MDFTRKGPSSLKTEEAVFSKAVEQGFLSGTQSINSLQVKVTGVMGEEREQKLASQLVCQGQVFLGASVPPVLLARAARTKCHTLVA